MEAAGNRLDAAEIAHVVPDGLDPSTYHWLYIKGGFLVKMNVKSGEIVEAKTLPSPRAIREKAGVQAPTVTTSELRV